ncbi:MAG: 3'-5' exonuclease domain-containing protein 2 [Bacteroidales bacterium]|nr:3'-5' exonuclease domain-containing protein 2 [Bacteroidales bacterium]MBQ7819147.1 3'-5' exonuclease domain-containing protein 2 [Bacteroidales bacterium]
MKIANAESATITNNNELTHISKEEIANLEKDSFGGKIVIIISKEEAKKAISYLSTQKIVGIDTESKPMFKKGGKNKIALLQISTSDICFLFRLNIIGITDEIKSFFENENISKVGLSLKDDFLMLHKAAAFEPKNFIDIQTIIEDYGIGDKSLQKIYAILFGKKISKSQRLSNWEADSLSDAQKRYAATDAWAVLRIFEKLSDKE